MNGTFTSIKYSLTISINNNVSLLINMHSLEEVMKYNSTVHPLSHPGNLIVLAELHHHHNINRAAFVCLSVLSVCLFVPYLLRGPLTDLRQTSWVYCRWTSELPLRGSFSKRSTARRVNGSLSLSTILYMCQPHSTQLQKATLLLLHLIRLKGTFCCTDGWWVYVGGSRNCVLDG